MLTLKYNDLTDFSASQLTSRPREKQLNFRPGSAEKSSARLAANGVIIKKNKNGG